MSNMKLSPLATTLNPRAIAGEIVKDVAKNVLEQAVLEGGKKVLSHVMHKSGKHKPDDGDIKN